MKFLFLMDPLETVNVLKDTSFIFMHGAHERGIEVYYLPIGGITLKNAELFFNVTRVTPQKVEGQPFLIHEELTLAQADVSAVFIRTEPPFDSDYIMHTWMLDLLPDSIPVFNKPSGVRDVNEKVWTAQFSDLVPRTVITRNEAMFKDFLKEEGLIIAKPTDGFGGAGVFKVSQDGDNRSVIFEILSENGKKDVILQEYIPEAEKGDKRILLLNGDILGAVLRVHGKDDHRNNFFAGGTAQACDITTRDREICKKLKPYLIEKGLMFVGIDIIGDKLIEVNVTSPTCLQEMNRLYDLKLEDKVIDFVLSVVDSK